MLARCGEKSGEAGGEMISHGEEKISFGMEKIAPIININQLKNNLSQSREEKSFLGQLKGTGLFPRIRDIREIECHRGFIWLLHTHTPIK